MDVRNSSNQDLKHLQYLWRGMVLRKILASKTSATYVLQLSTYWREVVQLNDYGELSILLGIILLLFCLCHQCLPYQGELYGLLIVMFPFHTGCHYMSTRRRATWIISQRRNCSGCLEVKQLPISQQWKDFQPCGTPHFCPITHITQSGRESI